MPLLTIESAMKQYINSVRLSRSLLTAKTYATALKYFSDTLLGKGIIISEVPISSLQEDSIVSLAIDLKDHAPTTERLYLQAVSGFFEFLVAEKLADLNLPRVKLLIHQRGRRPGQRLPQFPSSSIDKLLDILSNINYAIAENETEKLINLRDRAFLITLADTGLRVNEACNLRRGDLDWNEGKAMIIGKGNQQAMVRFSTRATDALLDYLRERGKLDGKTKVALSALPLFSRHDKGAGQKIKPLTTTSGRNIVSQRVAQFLGEEYVGSITPHSFRHYFVTRVLRSSGNLKLAQELARHKNIAVTQRYAHLSNDELDKGYWDAIEQDK
jgi:integrase/recombinase XerC